MVLSESAAAIHTMLHRAEFADAHPIVADAWADGSVQPERVGTLETRTEALSGEHLSAVLEIALPEAATLTQKDLYVVCSPPRSRDALG